MEQQQQQQQQRDESNVPPPGEAEATNSGEEDGEIRRDVPTLSGIMDFKKRIFSATKRQEARQKKRARKGKQPEIITHWNAVEGAEIQNGTPPLRGLHLFKKKVFETRKREKEKQETRARKGKGKQVESSAFTGYDEPAAQIGDPAIALSKPAGPGARVPNGDTPKPKPVRGGDPKTKTANALTGEPVEETDGPPARAARALESPQEKATPQSRIVPVEIPLSKFQRVMHMEFRSSIQLKARELTLSGPDFEKLHTFSVFVGTPNQPTLFGRQLPQCHRYLVELQRDGSEPHTYICIEGLKKEEDVRKFYSVMSQREYRGYYEPWKLCFRMAEVPKCAAPGIPPASGETDAPGWSCQIHIHGSATTLCGCVVRIKTKQGERIATIGGLIQAGGDLFALTTGHTSSAQQPEGLADDHATSTSGSSTSTTLEDLDLPDDVESILIIDDPKIEEGAHKMAVDWTSESLLVANTEIIHEGEDWCLIPIPETYHLPNLCGIPDVHMITGVCSMDDPGGQLVYAAGGVSGPVAGYVSAAPSFLDGLNGPIQVRAVNLRGGNVISMGDSGSWFVTQSSARVLGPVVAMCAGTGKALITMLTDQFASISRRFPFDDYPTLAPSPLLLLRTANLWYATGQADRAERLANLYLVTIATSSSFQHSDLTLTLKVAIDEFSDEFNQALKWVIIKTGTSIESLITSPRPENYWVERDLSSLEKIVLRRLGDIYRRQEWLVTEHNVPPSNFWSATERAPTQGIFPELPSTAVGDTEDQSTEASVGDTEDQSTEASVDLEHNVHQPPRAHLERDHVVNRVLDLEGVSSRGRNRSKRRKLLWEFSIILGVCYLAGLGVGAWKLITADGVLDLGGKIGTGVAVIFVNLFLITVVYMLKTSH